MLRRSFVWPRVADSNCLLRADARAVEQTLIDYHGLGKDGGTLINMINFISSVKKPTKYEQGLIRVAELLVVQSAVNQGLLSVVANVPVPERLQMFPTFRSRNGGPGGSIWLWNGSEALRLERKISSEELKHSTRGIISAPLLVERIEKNYRAETYEVW